MKAWKKYWAFAWIAAKSNLAYAYEVGGRLFFLAVVLFIFMRLWKVTFAHAAVPSFGGFSLKEILWYLALTETIMLSAPRVTPLVDEDVRTGTLAVQLVRPLSYPLYRLATDFGDRVVRFVLTGCSGIVIALALAGPMPAGADRLLYVLAALPGAFILDFLGYFLVGLGAFWLEDTSGLMLIYSRLTMILGGMLLPLDLFPANWQFLLKALPFGNIVYGPARLLIHGDLHDLAVLIVNQFFWIAIFSLAVAAVYTKATRRIAVNGG